MKVRGQFTEVVSHELKLGTRDADKCFYLLSQLTGLDILILKHALPPKIRVN